MPSPTTSVSGIKAGPDERISQTDELGYAVSPDAVVWGSIGLTGTPDRSRVSLDRWVEFVRTQRGRQTLFHFDVEASRVVAIEEQYVP